MPRADLMPNFSELSTAGTTGADVAVALLARRFAHTCASTWGWVFRCRALQRFHSKSKVGMERVTWRIWVPVLAGDQFGAGLAVVVTRRRAGRTQFSSGGWLKPTRWLTDPTREKEMTDRST